MEHTEFATATVRQNGNQLSVSHGDDSGLIVQFYNHSVRQGAESEKAGRDIFKDVPYIWIRFVGDRTREIRRPVDYQGRNGHGPDPQRFPKAWAAFQAQGEVPQEGTPLEQFPPLGRSTVLNFKAVNIHTVEQLAAVSDANLQALGTGGMELRTKAQAWLAKARDGAAVSQLSSEVEKLREDNAALKAQLAQVSQQLEKLQSDKGRGRG